MALVGRLEDLGLTELFHLLSLYQKTGKLTINDHDRVGIFVFRSGKLIHATNGVEHAPLGHLLVERQMVKDEIVEQALAVQRTNPTQQKIGTILVEMGAITTEQLEMVIAEQLQEIAEDFLHCTEGFFNFRPFHKDKGGDRSSGEEMELASGMNSDQFILDLLTRIDEDSQHLGPLPAPSLEAAQIEEQLQAAGDQHSEHHLRRLLDYMVEPHPYESFDDPEERHTSSPTNLDDLRSLLVELQLRSPTFTGEITLMILRFATRIVNRGVLFGIFKDGISGVGQFGLDFEHGKPADRRVRDLMIPTHEPSVFFEVIEKMHTYRGPLKPCEWNDFLCEHLGGGVPTEVVAVPIVVDGMIVAVFLGDNLPDDEPIGSIQGLEILMIEAGLAMERRLLRARLEQAEERIRTLMDREESSKNPSIDHHKLDDAPG